MRIRKEIYCVTRTGITECCSTSILGGNEKWTEVSTDKHDGKNVELSHTVVDLYGQIKLSTRVLIQQQLVSELTVVNRLQPLLR